MCLVARSLQRIKRSAYFFVRWTLFVIGFDLDPCDFSIFVDYVNRRMRNAINLLAFVSGITQTISVDDLMFSIGEHGKVDSTFPVGRDLLGETIADLWWVDADRVELYVLILLQQRS